jgi:hypothetical protein
MRLKEILRIFAERGEELTYKVQFSGVSNRERRKDEARAKRESRPKNQKPKNCRNKHSRRKLTKARRKQAWK